MAVANFTKELQRVEDGPIQQNRARIAKLKESIQESSPKINKMRQEESQGQQRKSGSDAGRVSQDRFIEPSGERRSERTYQDHDEQVRAWAEQSTLETRAYAEAQEGYCKDELYQIMRSGQKKGRVCKSSIGYEYDAQSLNKDEAGKCTEHSDSCWEKRVRGRSHNGTPRKKKRQSSPDR